MNEIRDTPELINFYNEHKLLIEQEYINRTKQLISTNTRINGSIAFNLIKELGIDKGYRLTECQINKLVPLVVLKIKD